MLASVASLGYSEDGFTVRLRLLYLEAKKEETWCIW